MNILIIGEFSTFAKHLKNGLVKLGHEVVIVHTGDGWKNLGESNDILFTSRKLYIGKVPIKGSKLISGVFSNIRVDRVLKTRFEEPDLIIIVNYGFIRKNILYKGIRMKQVKRWVEKGLPIVMTECGNSPAVGYYSPEFYQLTNTKVDLHDFRYSYLLSNSRVIIPTAYSYYEGLMRYSTFHPFDTNKVWRAIPLPMTIDAPTTITSCVGRKIVIFHGISRPIAKGTPFIEEAMCRLRTEMPDKVECIINGRLPYSEYIKVINKMDILVDQTYGNGWGMNAALGALLGKCVLAPCGPENSENMGIPYIPFIKIEPDSEQIYQVLKELVLHPERVDKIKADSRLFIEKYCDSKIVAQQYLEAVGLKTQN